MTVEVSLYIKTKDQQVTIGLDGAVPQPLATADTSSGEWTKVTARAELPKELNSAEIYVETDGNAEFFVDEVFVCPVREM